LPVTTLVWPVMLFAVAAAALAGAAGAKPAVRVGIAALAAAGSLIGGTAAPARVLLAVIGPGSAAAIVLGIGLLARATGYGSAALQPSRALLACVLLTGLLLYPMTAGLTQFDPFALGYRGVAVPALMAAIVVIGWMIRVRDVPCWIALAALMHVLQVYSENNLWLYLIDPVAVFIAAGWLVAELLRSRRPALG
jgi:hypothetical protein